MVDFLFGGAVGLVVGAFCPALLSKVKSWVTKEKVVVLEAVTTPAPIANTK